LSKRTTTRGYIVSWIIYVLAWVATFMIIRGTQGAGSPPPIALVMYLVLVATAIAMLIFWIGALVRLGQVRRWGWFVAVLVLHLVGLGIVAMVAYAIAGPDDAYIVAIRPPLAT
jgi:glucan phosphoethanolaminetransferase (alkaline phosphatase superfamily)